MDTRLSTESIIANFLAEAKNINDSNEIGGFMLDKIGVLSEYLCLLDRWNKSMDLVAPASLEVMAHRHIVDSVLASLLIQQVCKVEGSKSYVDVGSGAGLPGVVLSICEPEREVVLLEPREKRCLFLREVVRELKLKNTKIARGRTDDFKLDSSVGLIIARAVGDKVDLAKFAKRCGVDECYVVEMRTGQMAELADKAKIIAPYLLPPDKAQRALIISQP